MTTLTPAEILEIPVYLDGEDYDSVVLRDMLIDLLKKMWYEGECFDSKRPFGNSDWQEQVYRSLHKAGAYVDYDSDEFDRHEAENIILEAIQAL